MILYARGGGRERERERWNILPTLLMVTFFRDRILGLLSVLYNFILIQPLATNMYYF